jgi:hypothetical protein
MKIKILLLSLMLIAPVFASYAIDIKDFKVDFSPFYDGTKIIKLSTESAIIYKEELYNIDIEWTPDDGLSPRLTGAAKINFHPIQGDSFSIFSEAFHLPDSMLDDLGIIGKNAWSINREIDLKKTHSFNYESLVKISLIDNSHQSYNYAYDVTPFFFEDVNYDGEDELVIVNTSAGQRWVNSYSIYKKNQNNGFILFNEAPFNTLDQLSTFDQKNRAVDVFSSGGLCTNSNKRYRLIEGKYILVEFIDWDSYPTNNRIICVKSKYNVVSGERILKSKAESYWSSEINDYIELGVKYY